MPGRARRKWLPFLGAAVFVACSLSSLDDLKTNGEDAGADASSAKCSAGVDCSGCPSCAYFCACIAGPHVLQCMAGCQDSGTADSSTGGVGGTGGAAGSAGAGGAGASGGASCDKATACTECCAQEQPAGAQEYSDMISNCICDPADDCYTPCYDYCQGADPTTDCSNCFANAASQSCVSSNCGTPCQAFLTCVAPCYTQ